MLLAWKANQPRGPRARVIGVPGAQATIRLVPVQRPGMSPPEEPTTEGYLPPHIRKLLAETKTYRRIPKSPKLRAIWDQINSEPMKPWNPAKGLPKARRIDLPLTPEMLELEARLKRELVKQRRRMRYRKKHPTVKYKTRYTRKDGLLPRWQTFKQEPKP